MFQCGGGLQGIIDCLYTITHTTSVWINIQYCLSTPTKPNLDPSLTSPHIHLVCEGVRLAWYLGYELLHQSNQPRLCTTASEQPTKALYYCIRATNQGSVLLHQSSQPRLCTTASEQPTKALHYCIRATNQGSVLLHQSNQPRL